MTHSSTERQIAHRLTAQISADQVTENPVTQFPGEPGSGSKPGTLSLQGLHGTTGEMYVLPLALVHQKGRGCNRFGNLVQNSGRFTCEINTINVFSSY